MMPKLKDVFEGAIGLGRSSPTEIPFSKNKEDPESLALKDLISTNSPKECKKVKKRK